MLALGACRDSGGEGEYFEIAGKLFVFNYRVATATYLVNLDAAAADGRGRDGGRAPSRIRPAATPIVVRQKIWPKLRQDDASKARRCACVVKDRPYAVSIRIEAADGTCCRRSRRR